VGTGATISSRQDTASITSPEPKAAFL
jgi:hypothetical protein